MVSRYFFLAGKPLLHRQSSGIGMFYHCTSDPFLWKCVSSSSCSSFTFSPLQRGSNGTIQIWCRKYYVLFSCGIGFSAYPPFSQQRIPRQQIVKVCIPRPSYSCRESFFFFNRKCLFFQTKDGNGNGKVTSQAIHNVCIIFV